MWLERTELCALFFGDGPLEAGRLSLRQLISRARRLEWATALEVEGDRLRFQVASDLSYFRTHLGNRHWEGALEVPSGEFLEGMSGPTAFVRWLDAERQQVRDGWQEACAQEAQRLSDLGRFEDSMKRLEGVLEGLGEHGGGPARETVLKLYLTSALRCGQQATALERFEVYRARLLEDYGTLTGASVLALVHDLARDLAHRLERGLERGSEHGKPPSRRTPARSSGEPERTTPLWGRDAELSLWRGALESGHRLLSLWAGPGVGKTRLALELCAWARSAGRGVCYVDASSAQFNSQSNEGSESSEGSGVTLETLLADALQLSLEERSSGEAGLWQALSADPIVLVLDHIGASETLMARLLEHCPSLCILGVGHQPLPEANFSRELPGLSGTEALELLEGMGRQAGPARGLTRRGAGATSVPTQLQGSYSALELYLCGVGGLELSNATPELTLESRLERCFEGVWSALSEAEKAALRLLSHFAEGCSPETAEVLGVARAQQMQLERRGLLQGGERWVRLHGALSSWLLEHETQGADERSRQKATAKWQGEGHALERSHFFHYMRSLSQQEHRLGGPHTAEQLAELDADKVGLRRALCWGLKSAREREVEAAFETLIYGYAFYRALEGGPQTLGQTLPLLLETDDALFTPVATSLPPEALLSLERMRLGLGLGLAGLGSSTIARKTTRFAAQRLLELGARQGAALAWGWVALLDLWGAESGSEAHSLPERSMPERSVPESNPDHPAHNPSASLELAASLAGRPLPALEGQTPPQQALTLSGWLEVLPPLSSDPCHRAWTQYSTQLVVGHAAISQGMASAAREAYGRALEGAQTLNHPGALAWAQMHSGRAYLLEGNWGEALGCLNLALEAGRRMAAPFLMLEVLSALVELHAAHSLAAAQSRQVQRDLEGFQGLPQPSSKFNLRAAGLLERLRVGVS